MTFMPDPNRYSKMPYIRSGRSGLLLPQLSLGLWQNFGENYPFENSRSLIHRAFDLGITHFDLANNYGPPPGSAEVTFGKILRSDLMSHRDEMIISTKAGYTMWKGPYGDWGSRKYLLTSLDQSLKRMGLEYVDIFYHHRPDPETPIEETMGALDQVVRQGKALYVGISNYSAEQTIQAVRTLRELGTPCVIHQLKYSMFVRSPEKELLGTLKNEGIGGIVFSPLAQGLLTNRYLNGIPKDSRVGNKSLFLTQQHLTEKLLGKIQKLNELAKTREQSLAQLAISWILRQPQITSVLFGASKVGQIEELCIGLSHEPLNEIELNAIELILKD